MEKRLERAEEAAAERAKGMLAYQLPTVIYYFSASIKNATKSFLSTEGPDIANINDIRKFETMKAWLDDENALLLRSPPGSGKTTFALSFAAHLYSTGFKATYLNASLARSAMDDTKSMDNVWQDAFQFDSTFSDMCTTPSEEDHYIIIDEAQSWYPSNVEDWRTRQQLNHFWADVKFFVKPALELANYVQNPLSHSPTRNNPSSPTGRVRLLCLAGYGEANVGSIATPLVFVDPLDSTKNLRLPLGLEFLRLDLEMTLALIAKYVEIIESEGKRMTFGTDVRELIYQETNGHVGAVRTLLFHFANTDKRSKQDVIDFTQREVYQTDLSAYRSFLSVSQATIRKLRPEDLAMLIQCIAKYKQGHRGFLVEESRVAELVKLGMFVKTTATAIGGRTTIAFPSPLHYDLALYNVLHRTVELQPTAECFERVLKELVLRMSPKVLLETTPNGHIPYEDQWHYECHRSFSSMSSTCLKTSVDREFEARAFLDMYINDGFQWGIELMREGDGRRLDEHFRRFQPGGRYSKIPMREYALINFTSKSPSQFVLDSYDSHVWHLVYNDKYTQVTVYQNGKYPETWDLIGHQGRTEN